MAAKSKYFLPAVALLAAAISAYFLRSRDDESIIGLMPPREADIQTAPQRSVFLLSDSYQKIQPRPYVEAESNETRAATQPSLEDRVSPELKMFFEQYDGEHFTNTVPDQLDSLLRIAPLWRDNRLVQNVESANGVTAVQYKTNDFSVIEKNFDYHKDEKKPPASDYLIIISNHGEPRRKFFYQFTAKKQEEDRFSSVHFRHDFKEAESIVIKAVNGSLGNSGILIPLSVEIFIGKGNKPSGIPACSYNLNSLDSRVLDDFLTLRHSFLDFANKCN